MIWATELKERRSTSGGGKGRPSTTSYSYSASFAVLLSARSICAVRRIWADGKLLRGAAGDWKVPTGFRLHLGDPDQAADPLIASAEGRGGCPAHRGHAYAVFEDLELAEFGNRIPSLTFEVVADDTALGFGEIAGRCVPGLTGATGAPFAVGFAASGDDRRVVVDLLGEIGGLWLVDSSEGWRLTAGDGGSRLIGDDGAAPDGEASVRAQRQIVPIDRVARSVVLRHHDPARDYQIGVQQARRPGAGMREVVIDAPMTIAADSARGLALAAIERAEAERETRRIAGDWRLLGVRPGSVVRIAGEGGSWRVSGWTFEKMVVTLDLTRVAAPPVPRAASPGRVLPAPDLLTGRTVIELLELPPVEGLASRPSLFAAASGTEAGWRSAALTISGDAGLSWIDAGVTAAPAVIGTVVEPPRRAPATLIDMASHLVVELSHSGAELNDADWAALDQGANLAMVGDELLQFGRAEPLGERRWRLSMLWRGRRGTEFAAGTQQAGDGFVLIEHEALAELTTLSLMPGMAVMVGAEGIGDEAGPVERSTIVTGWGMVPPAPVHLRAAFGGGDAIALRWTRRSRAGWRWRDHVDVPLGEEIERYQLRVIALDGTTSITETATPAAEVAGSVAAVEVRQIGSHGLSQPAVFRP